VWGQFLALPNSSASSKLVGTVAALREIIGAVVAGRNAVQRAQSTLGQEQRGVLQHPCRLDSSVRRGPMPTARPGISGQVW
jgi:hypothetical protein